ncbi:MAG TPA: head GIN domain-containing protein [Flavobacterium sp.]|uniref:head GIN domain-containing protein n=1 Tax=Flavobacterium sp. TaxID=239 RepID=UPI002C4EEB22|nr:head GIN domain-containing protein [Flavobacterium sp.]HSD15385.1 head GIN domain-containing protein [Flavobacterium sp.]
MKRLIFTVLLFATQLGFSQTKITKSVGDFTSVKAFDKISVQLVESTETKVELSGERSGDVELVNKNGELKIRMAVDKSLKGEDVTAIVYFKKIEAVEASEGAYVSSPATFNAVEFAVSAKEGAEVKLTLDVKKVNIKANSGGMVRLTGKASNQDIVVTSGGIVKASALEGEQTVVAVNAGGEADVTATDLVEAKTRAGGIITIYGNPRQVNQKTIAGGTIRQHKLEKISK